MTIGKTKINWVALVCAGLMVMAAFLPWGTVTSTTSAFGYSSSYKSSVTGMQAGVGIIPVVLGTLCGVLLFIRSRFVIIPGIICLIFSIFEAVSMQGVTSNVYTSIGEGHAGGDYGIYVLLISCIVYIAALLVKTPAIEAVNLKPIKPENQSSRYVSPIKTKHILKGLLIAVVSIVSFMLVIYFQKVYENYQSEQFDKMISERNRLENIVEEINEAVSEKNFDLALTKLSGLTWHLEPSSYPKMAAQYAFQKVELHQTIEKSKAEYIAANLQPAPGPLPDSPNETEGGVEPSTFPFETKITAQQSILYEEPNIHSAVIFYLQKDYQVTILAREGDFSFCRYFNEGNPKSGWLVTNDFR